MKVYFNTRAFDCLREKSQLDITNDIIKAELAVMGSKTIDFNRAINLKAIYRFGVGRENIPEEVISNKQPEVFFPSETTRDILYESTANFTVALVFRMYYESVKGDINNWNKYTRDMITNKRCLVIGCGNIGKKVLGKLKPFLQVEKYDIRYNKFSDLERLVKEADIITFHLPLNKETYNFFDSEKLSWVKDKAIIINTSRGAIFNENDLYKRLINSNIKAAFDVFWQEPYQGKLKQLNQSKFFMTPHTSSQTIEYVRAGFDDVLKITQNFKEKK